MFFSPDVQDRMFLVSFLIMQHMLIVLQEMFILATAPFTDQTIIVMVICLIIVLLNYGMVRN